MLLVSKKKIGGNHAFFRNNKASISNKTPYIALYFTAFLNYCSLIISVKCVVTPNFRFGFQQPLLKSTFPHSHKPCKNTSVLVGTVLHGLSRRYLALIYLSLPLSLFFNFHFAFSCPGDALAFPPPRKALFYLSPWILVSSPSNFFHTLAPFSLFYFAFRPPLKAL